MARTPSPRSSSPRRVARRSLATRAVAWSRRAARMAAYVVLATAILILALRWAPPPTSMFMLIRHAERLLATKPGPPILYTWTARTDIPTHVALAVVAAEDQNFPRHFGFDLTAIARAVKYNETHDRMRGASTITQQTVKNLFLWPGRSLVRKGFEAVLTLAVEVVWPKARILEIYLNVAEFGDGTYGVGAAAKRYFGKTPQKLSRREAAVLASVLPSPRRLHAKQPSSYVNSRAKWVQTQMRQLGQKHITWP